MSKNLSDILFDDIVGSLIYIAGTGLRHAIYTKKSFRYMGAEAGAVIATLSTALSGNSNYADNLVCGAGAGYGLGAVADVGKHFLIKWGKDYELSSAEVNLPSLRSFRATIAFAVKESEQD